MKEMECQALHEVVEGCVVEGDMNQEVSRKVCF